MRPAGIGDVLTGVFAVPAAIAVATGTAQGRRAAIIWNIFGLADFAVAITLGLITSPGRFQLIVPDVLSIGAGTYPGVLTPAFVVPSSILLHVLSLRQLRRRRRAEAAPALETRLGEAARQAFGEGGLGHVVPRGQREEGHIKQQENLTREVGAAGRCDRGAETAMTGIQTSPATTFRICSC